MQQLLVECEEEKRARAPPANVPERLGRLACLDLSHQTLIVSKNRPRLKQELVVRLFRPFIQK